MKVEGRMIAGVYNCKGLKLMEKAVKDVVLARIMVAVERVVASSEDRWASSGQCLIWLLN